MSGPADGVRPGDRLAHLGDRSGAPGRRGPRPRPRAAAVLAAGTPVRTAPARTPDADLGGAP
ncbi:hypothetical protein [Streptomyces sp. TS71-3]|uniref:hypothetical protein n=1 Tax=Streptomyces sp. TS71-3 TaxID=2733862 RepID=UPI001BB3BB66|nr:hypothetical protein [Streptomyces sp. TS71-3]